MIDISREDVFALSEVPDRLKLSRRGGRKLHKSTPFRWRNQGLEVFRVGGTLCTSLEALQRFFEKRTETRKGAKPPTPASRAKANAAEARQLDALGI